MSTTRAIWNDGQGLASPDLQRPADAAGAADDRAHEVLITPGTVAKKVIPLLEETATAQPRLLAIPSNSSLTPAGTTGGVRLMACELVAGSATSGQQINLAGTLYAPLDTAAIATNTSGSTRYDLVYAVLNRSVSVASNRKIKSATDGSLSSQTVNLADAPAITLAVNAGFLTGATPPTIAQINSALPGDTAPSSSTFGTFNFPIAYVTVANGYTSGTLLSQDSGGTSYINQAWSGGFVQPERIKSFRPGSIYYGSATERISTSTLAKGVQNAERWGAEHKVYANLKLLTTTATTVGTGVVVDNTIDWRNRILYGFYSRLGSGNYVIENNASAFPANPYSAAGSNPQLVYGSGVIAPMWTGTGNSAQTLLYSDGSNFVSFGLGVKSTGELVFLKISTPIDATNGDLLTFIVCASDPIKLSG